MKRRSLFMSLKMQLSQTESLEGNFCCQRRKNWSFKMTVCLCVKVLLIVCSIKSPQTASYICSAFRDQPILSCSNKSRIKKSDKHQSKNAPLITRKNERGVCVCVWGGDPGDPQRWRFYCLCCHVLSEVLETLGFVEKGGVGSL